MKALQHHVVTFLLLLLLVVLMFSQQHVHATTIISTVVGFPSGGGYSGDGKLATSSPTNNPPTLLFNPQQVLLDSLGNIYVLDSGNNAIRMLNISTGVVSTVFRGDIRCFVFDKQDNIYFADSNVLNFFNRTTKQVMKIGGSTDYTAIFSGPAMEIYIGSTFSMAIDSEDNVYTSSTSNQKIYVFNKANNTFTAIVGVKESIGTPYGLTLDSDDNLYFVTDKCVVMFLNKSSSELSTIIGSSGQCQKYGDGGLAKNALLNRLFGVFVDKDRNIILTETYSNNIRFINTSTSIITTVTTVDTGLNFPYSTFVDKDGNFYVTDTNNHVIKKGNVTSPNFETILGVKKYFGFSGDDHPVNLVMNNSVATLNIPCGITFDEEDNMYIADQQNYAIRSVNSSTNIIGTFVNQQGPPRNLKVYNSMLYFSEYSTISKIDIITKQVTLIAGKKGGGGNSVDDNILATDVAFNAPCFAIDNQGNLYIGDAYVIRYLDKNTGKVNTFAGTRQKTGYTGDGGNRLSAKFSFISDLTFDSEGNLFIADCRNHVIRKIDMTTNNVSTVAGIITKQGFNGDNIVATSSHLSSPSSIAFDSYDNMYIGDTSNTRIRMVNRKTGIITTIVGNQPAITFNDGDGGQAVQANIPSITITQIYVAIHKGDLYFTQGNSVRKVEGTLCGEPLLSDMICSGNGGCMANDTCSCSKGWKSSNCSVVSLCSDHGVKNNNSVCQCDGNWFGTDCELFTCFGNLPDDNLVCSGNGVCKSPDNCECLNGYHGSNCSQFSCFGIDKDNSSVCNGNGNCIDLDTCSCALKYGNKDCTISCFGTVFDSPNVCSRHGICQSLDQCNCSAGYSGNNCEHALCFSILSNNASVCSSHGVCISPDKCECKSTHDGLQCEHEIPVCFGISYLNSSVCSGHGSCESTNHCVCQGGWTGNKCEMTTCYNISMNEASVCSSHGVCKSLDNCECENGWFSSDCSLTRCFGIASNDSTAVCSSHGHCASPDTCICTDNYMGKSCNLYMCGGIDSQNETVCSGKGKCLSPDTCRCDEHYFGSNCEKYCRNEIHCSSHGECLNDASCQCYSNSSMGYFTGSSCNVCQSDYLGNMCFTKINQNSLEFSSLGTELLFNMYSPMNINPDCKELIDPSYITLLGSQPICKWKNVEKGIFEIVLGTSSSIKIGNSLPINVNIFTNSVTANYLNLTVHSPSQPLVPISYISNIENVYGSCDGIILDGSSSKSLDGSSLLYKWKLIDSPSVDSIISAEQLEKSIVTLPSSIPEGNYRFQLIVTSTLFGLESNPVNYNFTKKVNNIPHLGIDGPSLITVGFEQVPLYIKKYQYFDTECNNTSPQLMMNNFKWTLLEGPSNIKYQQLSNGDLFISSFEEKSAQKYVFEISATFLQNVLTKTVTITTVEESFSIILYQSLLNSTHVIINIENEPLISLISNSEWIFTCITSQNIVCENSMMENLNSSAKNHICTDITLPYSSVSKPSFEISLKIRDTVGSIKIDIPKPDQIIPVISLVSISPQKQSYLSTDTLSVQLMVSVNGNSDSIDDLITREWMLNGKLITSNNLVSNPSLSNFMAVDLSLLESGTLNNLTLKVSSKTQSTTSTYSLPFSIEKNPDPCSCTVSPSSTGYTLDTTYSIVCLKCLIPGVTTISIGFVGAQNVESTLLQQSSQSTLNIQLPYISSSTLTLFAITQVISTKATAKVYFTTTVLLPVFTTPTQLALKKKSWATTYTSLQVGDPRKIVYSYYLSIYNILYVKLQGSLARLYKKEINDCSIVENEWTDLFRIDLNDSISLLVNDYNSRNQLEPISENLVSYLITAIYQIYDQPKYSSKEIIENGLGLLQRLVSDSVKSPNLQISTTLFKAIVSTLGKISNAATCYQVNTITPQLINLIENLSIVKMRNQLTGLTLSIETDSASLISTRYYPFDLSNRKLYYGILPEEFMSYPSKASQFLPLGTNLRKPLQSKLWKITKSKIETSQNSVTTNVGFALSNNLLSSNMKLDYSFLFNSSAGESRVEIENGRIKNTTVEMLCLSDNLSCVLSTISKFNFVCNCGNDSNISLAQRVTTLYLDNPITPPSPSSQNQTNSNLGYLGFLALIPLILLIILIPIIVIIVRLKQKPKMSNPKNTSDIPMQTL